MKRRHPPDPDFMSPVARAALRFAYLAAYRLDFPPTEDPELFRAFIDLLHEIGTEP
jgi:hypothetical protein